MNRYVWGRLRHQAGRTAALMLGIIVATAAFVVLTGAARTTQLRTVGVVGHNYRSAYDILVRPRGSTTELERTRGLVRPNYLSGIFGGISMQQYQVIEHLPGVEVAAPIAMIGYVVPRVTLYLNIPSGLGSASRLLYRVENTWVFDQGLSRARDASDFIYVTKSLVTTSQELTANGITATETVAGRHVPVCVYPGLQKGPGPFAVSVRTEVGCYSPDTSSGSAAQPSAVTFWSFPVLMAAIDPSAEARLVGLNKAVVAGRYLRNSDSLTSVSAGGAPSSAIPVLSPTRSDADEQLDETVWRLHRAAAQQVLRVPLVPATAQGRFGNTPGTMINHAVVSAGTAYRQLLTQIRSSSASSFVPVDAIWTPGRVSYTVTNGGLLRPRTVTVVVMHGDRPALRLVLAAGIGVVSDLLLLLGIHADHRLPGIAVLPDLLVEIAELGVPVRVPPALDDLGVALQAEALLPQHVAEGVCASTTVTSGWCSPAPGGSAG